MAKKVAQVSEAHPLSEDEIDRIAARVGGSPHISVKQSGADGGFRRLIDGLLVVGVASLIAVVWNLSNTVSILTTQVTYISSELAALRARSP